MAIEVEALSDGSVSEQTDALTGDRFFVERSGSAAWISFSNLFGTEAYDALGLGDIATSDAADFLPTTGGTVGGNVTVNGSFTVNGGVDISGTTQPARLAVDGTSSLVSLHVYHTSDSNTGFRWTGVSGEWSYVNNGSTKYFFNGDGTSVPNNQTAMTRQSSDNRYTLKSTLGTEIGDLPYGADGTYIMARYTANIGGSASPGATTAGSNLKAANAVGETFGGALPGTWRLEGFSLGIAVANGNHVSLWKRIA